MRAIGVDAGGCVVSAVTADLPADRRGAASQLGSDRPQGSALAMQIGDHEALVLAQETATHAARRNARPSWRLVGLPPGPGLLNAEPPPISGLAVHPDDPARLTGAVSLSHQGKVRRSLLLELHAP